MPIKGSLDRVIIDLSERQYIDLTLILGYAAGSIQCPHSTMARTCIRLADASHEDDPTRVRNGECVWEEEDRP